MHNVPALEVKNVSKQYKNGVLAVDDVSFTVNQGDFFALLGPNGAGKSSTLGMISSLVTKTHGEIFIHGYSVDRNPIEARKHLGVMPQEVNLNIFESALQILITQAGYFGIPRVKAYENSERLLKEMGLWDKRNDQIRHLSGGMKRRVMVARALVHEPKLLILDEPTAGVDVELRASLWESMNQLNKEGLTVILTTHYLEEAESMCNRIAIINNGKLHTDSDMKSLLRSVDNDQYILDLKVPLKNDCTCEYVSIGDCKLIDETTLEVITKKGTSLNQLFSSLTEQGIEVADIRAKSAKLEQLFIKVARSEKV